MLSRNHQSAPSRYKIHNQSSSFQNERSAYPERSFFKDLLDTGFRRYDWNPASGTAVVRLDWKLNNEWCNCLEHSNDSDPLIYGQIEEGKIPGRYAVPAEVEFGCPKSLPVSGEALTQLSGPYSKELSGKCRLRCLVGVPWCVSPVEVVETQIWIIPGWRLPDNTSLSLEKCWTSASCRVFLILLITSWPSQIILTCSRRIGDLFIKMLRHTPDSLFSRE